MFRNIWQIPLVSSFGATTLHQRFLKADHVVSDGDYEVRNFFLSCAHLDARHFCAVRP
jgi:hypothetical protein